MMNRGLIVFLIVLLSIIAIVLTAGFVLLLNIGHFNINYDFSFDEGEMELIDSKEAKCDSINNIDFKVYSIDIEVKPSENDEIKVEYYSTKNEDDRVEIKVEDDTFKVEEKDEKAIRVGINFYRNKLILYVPLEYEGNYNIAATSGDIKSEIDMSNNKLNLATTSGDIKLEIIGESSVESTSGDIRVNKIKENTNVVSTSGDVWIGEARGNIKTNSTSGDIKIDGISGATEVKTTSGDVTIGELDIEENSKIETTSGDVYIKNNVYNCYIDTKTTSGDVKINQSDRKSEIELLVNTVSGDISVN